MAEPKPLASLSAGLLARKGTASPAMRRQQPGLGIPRPSAMPSSMALDDCGWNDMGYDVDPTPGHARHALDLRPLLTAAPAQTASCTEPVADAEAMLPEIVRQQAALSQALAAADLAVSPDAAPAQAPMAVPTPMAMSTTRRAAFTLRLDADRHLRLRLASAVMHRSSQRILIDLLDQYLASADVLAAIANGTGGTIQPSVTDGARDPSDRSPTQGTKT